MKLFIISLTFIFSTTSSAVNNVNDINKKLPETWYKFGPILQTRYEQSKPKMKLSLEQVNSFISFINNPNLEAPQLLSLQNILPKTTLELLRSVESRGVTLNEAEQMALYLQIVPEKFGIKNIAAFDENTSHIIGRDWHEIDYSGEGMTWEKQQLKYKPYGITNFKTLDNITKFFPVEAQLPYFKKIYSLRN